MKKIKLVILALLASVMTIGAAACELPDILGKKDSSSVSETTSETASETASESNSESISASEDSGEDEYDVITIAEALELCGEAGNITTERYYIRGIIETVSNPEYGEMTISDETGSIQVYGTYSADGSVGYKDFAEKPVKGDEVLLYCILQNYNGKKEVKNARLIEFVSNAGNFDESDYTEMSIEEARIADVGTLIKVDGVVAKITYANGMKPSGVYLVDESNSIYVYDGDLAGQVSVGNKITVLASKTYWVLEKEQNAASKHGYIGCNQLENAYLVENDGATNDFDKSWIEESTVKEIMDTPVNEDITTTIFKVNALVEKREGAGFTNYYFFDIDGETGSYTYTQCNGSDFAWIDEFSGKICTVYLSVINAKSTDTACVYRFLPVAIEDNDYAFNLDDAAEYAVIYHGVDQFESLYTADPALVLNTSVSSELLGFEGATLSYASDNEATVYFETSDGVMTMHCGEEGKAIVTVTGAYGEKTYSETVEITVQKPITYETITVADAIAAAVDTEVTVKGIVGPSVVNKNGFYLFGEDGSMIAVIVNTTDDLVGLEIGHEIILKGMRERYVKDDAATYAGQTCLVNCELLVNYYGNHEYSTAKFTQSTAAEFYALDSTVDYSTSVFVLSVTVNVVVSNYYTTLNLISGDTTLGLYCSGAGQYAWLQEFEGQEVTVEIAACNWNDKNYWRGCVLAVYTENGKVMNTLNFDTY